MILPQGFVDELRERIVLSDVIRRRVKLTHRGKEALGLCPFHKEKTPSFTVNDTKGFYHCFGCGAHGDAIRFLMEAEKLPFMEAIELLANMAGMKMPEPSKADMMREKTRTDLLEIMEQVCQFYQNQLFGLNGTKAREYFQKRGLSVETAQKFRLGYAPRGSLLLKFLEEKKFNLKTCQSLGLLAKNSQHQTLHDYFYDRVMFPVFDRKKRVIGFSGRVLEKVEPKYLNSPETELFHKGEQLFELPFAIDTIRQKNTAILVEGNMDVISLHQAGFTQTVAPMGTALTENQIQILWRMCDEPTICFDGDGAGQHAMIRAMNRALPILIPGKSLKFAVLSGGMDPDDMIRTKGPDEFKHVIKNAKTLIDVFWENILNTNTYSTPERMAKLQENALSAVKEIKNKDVQSLYEREIKRRLKNLTYQLTHKNYTPIPKIKAPTSDNTLLLSYLYAFPNQLGNYVDTLMELNPFQEVQEEALFHGWCESVLNGTELIIPDTLQEEIENLQKHHVFDSIEEELQQMLNVLRLKHLKKEFQEKQKEYLKTEDPNIKAELDFLSSEIEKL